MQLFIPQYLARFDYFVHNGYYYDNSGSRCQPYPHKGRDCSTGTDDAINFACDVTSRQAEKVDPCDNSEALARLCHDAPREDWFSARFGGNLPGTFITMEAALTVVCLGFEGDDWGRAAWPGNRAHVETSLGNGGGSVGFHSHATGMGYSRFLYHNLDVAAVPPHFLGDMRPPVIDWHAVEEIQKLVERVTAKPLKADDKGHEPARPLDTEFVQRLMVAKRWQDKPSNWQFFGDAMIHGTNKLKWANGIKPADGHWFGGRAIRALVANHR